jgi:hypothetical protein
MRRAGLPATVLKQECIAKECIRVVRPVLQPHLSRELHEARKYILVAILMFLVSKPFAL